MRSAPLISIITVTFNCENLVEETIESVLSQAYPKFEYIVIDGNSSDGTVEKIKKYESNLKWISEKDSGIYDAMNKGIMKATGMWILFMNAGDKFYDNTVLSSIFKTAISSDIDVIYGKTLIHYEFGNYIVTPDHPSKLLKCMPFCHQSVLVKADVLRNTMFDFSLKIAADHKCLLEIYLKNNNSFKYYNGLIADYDAKNGISAKQTLLGYKEGHEQTKHNDSFFRKIRIYLRAYAPNFILNPLCRLFFCFNPRYRKL